MRKTLWLMAVPLLLLQTGASRETSDQPDQPEPASPPRRYAASPPPRYEATGTVLENQRHGPELCFVVAESLPPQCGGVPVTNWDWEGLGGVESVAGTTWGAFHLVGTYDGVAFTVEDVTAPRPPAEPEPPAPLAATPCPEPPGGWEAVRPGHQALDAATQAARSQQDFAGLWVDYLEPPGDSVAEDPGAFVLNAAFTGDLDRHRTALRALWDGPLCVSHQPRTYRELRRIGEDLFGAAGRELGLEVLTTGIDESANAVHLTVVVLDDATRAALDRRYGKGAVQATAELRPVGVSSPAAGPAGLPSGGRRLQGKGRTTQRQGLWL